MADLVSGSATLIVFRAYRARQRGATEPSTHVAASNGDDALAAALQRNLQLEAVLIASQSEAARLRRDLVATEVAVDRLEERVTQLELERAGLLNQIAT